MLLAAVLGSDNDNFLDGEIGEKRENEKTTVAIIMMMVLLLMMMMIEIELK